MAMRGQVIACLVASLVIISGCNTRQRVAGGGVGLAVIGLGLTYSNEIRSEKEAEKQGRVGIAFLLTGLVVLFVAAALEESATQPKPKEIRVATQSEVERADQRAAAQAKEKRDRASTLTKQAQAAARVGDCAKVTELSAQVGAIDADFYGEVFMKDLAVQRCFVPAEPPPVPAEPVPALPPPVPAEPVPASPPVPAVTP